MFVRATTKISELNIFGDDRTTYPFLVKHESQMVNGPLSIHEGTSQSLFNPNNNLMGKSIFFFF